MLKCIISIFINFLVIGTVNAAEPTGYPTTNYDIYDVTGYLHFFVDPKLGDDNNNGAIDTPWKTFGHAIRSVEKGRCVINLREGNYGDISELGFGAYSDWVVVKAYNNEKAIFNRISWTEIGFVRFDGISIQPLSGNTGFITRNSSNIEFRNVKITGVSKYLSAGGLSITTGSNFLIYRCNIENSISGVKLTGGVSNVTISENKIGNLASTAISYERNTQNVIIERNHIYNAFSSKLESESEGYYPHHGSGISLRDGNVLIKNNIFRTLGTSSGIMTYNDTGSATSYSNIYIYNNLFYDIFNAYIMRFYRASENIKVINNTIIGSIQNGITPGRMELGYSIVVHEITDGQDGSSFTFANNILAGLSVLPQKSVIKNNIMWSFYYKDSSATFLSTLENNVILTSDEHSPTSYFTTGFFKGEVDLREEHGKLIDYSLISDSPAKNFGDIALQHTNFLNKIDKDGFIRKMKITRDEKIHSSGCFEEAVSVPKDVKLLFGK